MSKTTKKSNRKTKKPLDALMESLQHEIELQQEDIEKDEEIEEQDFSQNGETELNNGTMDDEQLCIKEEDAVSTEDEEEEEKGEEGEEEEPENLEPPSRLIIQNVI